VPDLEKDLGQVLMGRSTKRYDKIEDLSDLVKACFSRGFRKQRIRTKKCYTTIGKAVRRVQRGKRILCFCLEGFSHWREIEVTPGGRLKKG